MIVGIIAALLSAVTFALNSATVRRGVLSGSVMQIVTISILFGVPLFFIPALVAGDLALIGEVTTHQWILLILSGILTFNVARYTNYRAVLALGSNLASGITQASTVLSLAIAVVILGEQLTVLKIVGIVLTLAGPAVIAQSMRKAARRIARGENLNLKFTPNFTHGYFFGGLTVIGYGLSPPLLAAGLKDIVSINLGGLIAYGAALLVVLALLTISPHQRREALRFNRTAMFWFIVSGVTINVSQYLRFLAFGLAPVTVATPFMQLNGAFRLVFAWFLNRDYEVFDVLAITGVLLSVLGAVLVALDVGVLEMIVDIPATLKPILDWTWP